MYYEDMKHDLHREISKLCHFLQKDLPGEIIDRIASHCGFNSMKRNPMTNHLDVYSINSKISPLLRKGKHFLFTGGSIAVCKNTKWKKKLEIIMPIKEFYCFYNNCFVSIVTF